MSECPNNAGSLNNPINPDSFYTGIGPNGSTTNAPTAYVPPEFCVGEWNPVAGDSSYQEQVAAASLDATGAPLNVFRLLGLHQQGVMTDLAGTGLALNNTQAAFTLGTWVSPQTGLEVLLNPAWVGYDFGSLKTSYGQEEYVPSIPNTQSISSIRLVQPSHERRAVQVRIERSNGVVKVDLTKITVTRGATTAIESVITEFSKGPESSPGTFMLTALSSTSFSVYFIGASSEALGICHVDVQFNSVRGSFKLAGSYAINDIISFSSDLVWERVDVVNLSPTESANLIRIKQSAPSRYWRIVPTQFIGVNSNAPWEVGSIALYSAGASTLDDVQDFLFLENRDREYANQSTMIKVAYSPFDALSDLGKFGFQVADIYSFNTTFATMVKALGRPIVIGDVLELPSELQYDHNLKPVRKLLEVTDTSWASDGYTSEWKPIIFKFQASQLIPGQEHASLLGTPDSQKFFIDDSEFFTGIQQLQTGPLTSNTIVQAEANQAVPEKGVDTREVASGTNRFRHSNSYDGTDIYVEDGLPPDGISYGEGYKLPDVSVATDGEYFRLNYDPELKIPARLYKFSLAKNRWIFVETDKRGVNSSHKPSQREILEKTKLLNPNAKKI